MKSTQKIKKALISEKSFQEAGQGLYTFIVNKNARKTEIKEEIERLFGVNVKEVKTSVDKKTKSILVQKQRREKRYKHKKARVRLKKGQKIDLFEEESSQ